MTAGQTTFTKSAYPTDQTSASWGSLRDGHTYEFRVTAQNPGGEGSPSNTVQVVAHGGLPAPPTGLTATPGDGQATLRWTASPTPSVLYVIYQRDVTAGQSWQKLPLPVSGTSMTAGYLTNGHTYAFKVTASNASGDSQPSNVASAKPMPPLPQPPSGLTASAGDGQVTLRWTASPTSDVYYWIEYRANGSSWQRLKYPLSTCCSFTVRYLFNGTSYDFRVLATNLAGDSQPTNVASAKPMPPLPQPPSGLTASAATSANAVTLSWKASATSGVYYWIWYIDTSAKGTWHRLPLPVVWTSLTVNYLIGFHLYGFAVQATNVAGDSGFSNNAYATPWEPTYGWRRYDPPHTFLWDRISPWFWTGLSTSTGCDPLGEDAPCDRMIQFESIGGEYLFSVDTLGHPTQGLVAFAWRYRTQFCVTGRCGPIYGWFYDVCTVHTGPYIDRIVGCDPSSNLLYLWYPAESL